MKRDKLKDFRRHGPGRKPASWSKNRNVEGDVAARWERAAKRKALALKEVKAALAEVG